MLFIYCLRVYFNFFKIPYSATLFTMHMIAKRAIGKSNGKKCRKPNKKAQFYLKVRFIMVI